MYAIVLLVLVKMAGVYFSLYLVTNFDRVADFSIDW